MKKNKRDQHSLDINDMISQYMKDFIHRIGDDEYKNNNSFIYLENETLHLLFMYLFMTDNSNSVDESNLNLSKLAETLDRYIESNRQGYEEIIQLLKGRTRSSEND